MRCGAMLTGLFKDASFCPSPNSHTSISLGEVDRVGQCLGWRFSPMSIFFILSCSCAFSDAPHSRFWYLNPKLCLPDSLNLLVLALFQIYTRLFYLGRSIDLDSAWVKDSRLFKFSSFWRVLALLAMRHTRLFGVWIPNYAYLTL